MNKKGFTLIELLAVIVLIGIVGIIIVPSVLRDVTTSKEKSYEILVSNIKTAAENYFLECEYGDLKDRSNDAYCNFTDSNNITATLGDLVNSGMLSASDIDNNDKIIKDPKTNAELNNCGITITKNSEIVTDSNGIKSTKTIYTVENKGDSSCPSY